MTHEHEWEPIIGGTVVVQGREREPFPLPLVGDYFCTSCMAIRRAVATEVPVSSDNGSCKAQDDRV